MCESSCYVLEDSECLLIFVGSNYDTLHPRNVTYFHYLKFWDLPKTQLMNKIRWQATSKKNACENIAISNASCKNPFTKIQDTQLLEGYVLA